MKKKSLKFYFSFRSPYSWLASLMLKKNREDIFNKLEFIPFWEPDSWSKQLLKDRGGDIVYTAMSKEKHLYILQDVKRLCVSMGLDFKWPIDKANPCWDIPHLAYIQAKKLNLESEFFWMITNARWLDGQNICSFDVIESVSKSLGIEEGVLTNALENEDIRQQGADCLYQVYKDSVFGVPMFMNGREKFWGIDRLNSFISSIDRDETNALPDKNQQISELEMPRYQLSYDHAGGCG